MGIDLYSILGNLFVLGMKYLIVPIVIALMTKYLSDRLPQPQPKKKRKKRL